MNSTDRLREMQMKGVGGSKNPKILQTSYVHAPLRDIEPYSAVLRHVRNALPVGGKPTFLDNWYGSGTIDSR